MTHPIGNTPAYSTVPELQRALSNETLKHISFCRPFTVAGHTYRVAWKRDYSSASITPDRAPGHSPQPRDRALERALAGILPAAKLRDALALDVDENAIRNADWPKLPEVQQQARGNGLFRVHAGNRTLLAHADWHLSDSLAVCREVSDLNLFQRIWRSLFGSSADKAWRNDMLRTLNARLNESRQYFTFG